MSTKDLASFFNSTTITKKSTPKPKQTPKPKTSPPIEPTPTNQIIIPIEPEALHDLAFKILVQKTKLEQENQLPDYLKLISTTGEIETVLRHEELSTIQLSLSHLEFILTILNEKYQTLLKRFLSRYKKTDTHLLFPYVRIDEMLEIIDHSYNTRNESPQINQLKEEIEDAKTLFQIGIRTPNDLLQIRSTLLLYPEETTSDPSTIPRDW